MVTKITPQEALSLAIERSGGTEKKGNNVTLSELLGISRQAIGQWDQVPIERVLEVEKHTGVPRHQLRPDIYPEPGK